MILTLLVPIAVKSLIVAAAVLGLLKLAERRSASDRSQIAHLGLGAILLLPLAVLLFPTLDVAGPDFLAAPVAAEASVPGPAPADFATAPPVAAATPAPLNVPELAETLSPDWMGLLYTIPAAALLGLTLLALLRLVLLKQRASVMIEPNWLSALARAQQRMGFKHGTALLTSNDLPSPISWGVVRPVILLNEDAAGTSAEAEAVIAHELAHVANLDWAKLLLARICIALFWFNPLVWLLAREAHQLREEAADDAVLAANIEDTDYAKLLVGVARHECRGLLIGAHGVAPSKNSLSRRVRRVLDTALNRAPGGWRWTSAAAFFAAGMALPLAALTIVPPHQAAKQIVASKAAVQPARTDYSSGAAASATATRISNEVLPERQVSREHDFDPDPDSDPNPDDDRPTIAIGQNSTILKNGDQTIAIGPEGTVLTSGGRTISIASADGRAEAGFDDAVTLKALSVTPAFAKSLAEAGYPALDRNSLVQARALGIDAAYARSFGKVGYGRLPFGRLVEFKALGVTPSDIRRYHAASGQLPDPGQIVQMKALGVEPEEIDPAPDE